MDFSINNLLSNWVPYLFGVVGIIVFLAGVVKILSNKENGFSNVLFGLFIIAVAIGLRAFIPDILDSI